jgi:hypothetical protein
VEALAVVLAAEDSLVVELAEVGKKFLKFIKKALKFRAFFIISV